MKYTLALLGWMVMFGDPGPVKVAGFANRKISPADSSISAQLLALPLGNFIGKPVDSLLSALPAGYTSQGFLPVSPRRIKGVYQSYFGGAGNNCSVEIYIDTFSYLQVPSVAEKPDWSMALAKNETVAFIKVIKNDFTCVYGCNDRHYSME